MKKIILVIIISLLAAYFSSSTAPQITLAANPPIFTDVKGHWAEKAIYEMVDKGVVSGYSDGTFRPNGAVTAGQFITMLMLSLSEIKPEGYRWWADDFMDNISYATYLQIMNAPDFYFKGGKPFYKPFVDQAVNIQILPNRINPWSDNYDQPLKREDVAYLVTEALGATGEGYFSSYLDLFSPRLKDLYRLKNDGYVNSYYVLQMYATGIMNGYKNGYFGIGRTVSRAEAVIILQKLRDKSKRTPPKVDLSIYPYAYVPTGYSYKGIKRQDSPVVFPDKRTKEVYDVLLNSANQTKGVCEQKSTGFGFYRDQVTLDQQHANENNFIHWTDPPLHDLGIGIGGTSDTYIMSISTKDNALAKHEKVLQSFLKSTFDKNSKEARTTIDTYLEKMRDRVDKDKLLKGVYVKVGDRQLYLYAIYEYNLLSVTVTRKSE